jgi:hypothetical protein
VITIHCTQKLLSRLPVRIGQLLRSKYSNDFAANDAKPTVLSHRRADFRVAVALGIGWDCVRELVDEPRMPVNALRTEGFNIRLLEIEGLSSSERNAAIIATSLLEDLTDERPFILVGYANADHWAVAVPIDTSGIPFGSLAVSNDYDRLRLWRAMLDFLIAEVAKPPLKAPFSLWPQLPASPNRR